MNFAKFDPITGLLVSTGNCPDSDPQGPVDASGLLVFPFEGSLAEYQFDHANMALVKKRQDAVVELRLRLIEERRAPTPEELDQLAGPAPVLTLKPEE